jgi:predicted RNA-binding Zn-ribbon protein involved in translation (DUF1610 family)
MQNRTEQDRTPPVCCGRTMKAGPLDNAGYICPDCGNIQQEKKLCCGKDMTIFKKPRGYSCQKCGNTIKDKTTA